MNEHEADHRRVLLTEHTDAAFLDFLEQGPPHAEDRCKVGQWLDTLPQEDAARIERALQNKVLWPSAEAFLDVVESHYHANLSVGTTRRHRTRTCVCYKKKESK